MNNPYTRSKLLLGEEGMARLQGSTVAVFGVGGVGAYTVEALIRTGIGKIVLIDYGIIDITNINRQIHATMKTLGLAKVQVMRDRILEINPELEVVIYKENYNSITRDFLLFDEYDYAVDAIDMVSSKIDLIIQCKERGIPIISSMGAGNKLNPTMFKVGDIYSTKICPLAKVMRRELRKKGIKDLKVVWSDEVPKAVNFESADLRKAVPGSVGFVPPVVGLIIASEVIKDIAFQEV